MVLSALAGPALSLGSWLVDKARNLLEERAKRDLRVAAVMAVLVGLLGAALVALQLRELGGHLLAATTSASPSAVCAALATAAAVSSTFVYVNGGEWSAFVALACIRAAADAGLPALVFLNGLSTLSSNSNSAQCDEKGYGAPIALTSSVALYVMSSIAGCDLLPGRSGAAWRGVVQLILLSVVHMSLQEPLASASVARRMLAVALNGVLAWAVQRLSDPWTTLLQGFSIGQRVDVRDVCHRVACSALYLGRSLTSVLEKVPSTGLCCTIALARSACHATVACAACWFAFVARTTPESAGVLVTVVAACLAAWEVVSARSIFKLAVNGSPGLLLSMQQRACYLIGVKATTEVSALLHRLNLKPMRASDVIAAVVDVMVSLKAMVLVKRCVMTCQHASASLCTVLAYPVPFLSLCNCCCCCCCC
jgi:hypothetical protein